MPPPKKPKKGPTTAEQFLSSDEKQLGDADGENSTCSSPTDSNQSNSGVTTVHEDSDSRNSLHDDPCCSRKPNQDTSDTSSVLRQLFTTPTNNYSSPAENVKSPQNNSVPTNNWICTERGVPLTSSRCVPLTTSQCVPLNTSHFVPLTTSHSVPSLTTNQCRLSYQHYMYHRTPALFPSRQNTLGNVSQSGLTYVLDSGTASHSLGLSLVQVDQPSTSNMAQCTSSPIMSNCLQVTEPFNLSTKLDGNPSGEHQLSYNSSSPNSDTVSDFHNGHVMKSRNKSHDDKTMFLNNRPRVANMLQYAERDSISPVIDMLPKRMHYKNNPQQYDRNVNGRDMIGKPSESVLPVRSASPTLPMMHSGLPSTSSQAPTSTTSDVEEQNSAFLGNILFTPGEQPRRKFKSQLTDGGVPRVCQVCNDCASGFHYGVWSCEGCKAFYKRSIQGPVDYVCPATNNCTIDKHRRKSCQACRLRKCHEVGMNKASQRKERKKSSPGLNSTPKGKRNRSDSGESAVNSTSGSNGQSPTKCTRTDNVEGFVSSLVRADLPILQSCHNHNIMPSRVHLLNSLAKLADRELVYLINWAKHIPGYTDLSLSDQVHLIECSWMELLLLNCAFQSMDQNGAGLVFAPDLLLDRIHWNIIGMVDILEQVAAVAEQMAQYDIHKEELLLLKAAALVNAEVKRLSSYSKLQEMQQTVVDALLETAQKHHPNNSRHVPSILLLLSHIRQAGAKSITYFCQLQSEGSITFGDLLNEMLEAQTPVDKKPVITHDREPPSAF